MAAMPMAMRQLHPSKFSRCQSKRKSEPYYPVEIASFYTRSRLWLCLLCLYQEHDNRDINKP